MKFLIIFTIFVVYIQAEDVNPAEDPQTLDESSSTFITHRHELVVPDSVDSFVFQGNVSDAPAPSSRPGASVRISNGRQARDGQFPFVAELSINLKSGGGLLCTGSLIASNWILSARHCIADTNAQSVLASLGSADRQSSSLVKIYSSMFVWMNAGDGNHPDIAVFKLARNAPSNSRVRPILLPSRRHASSGFDGYLGTAIGFGGIGGGRLPRYLQYTQFRILSQRQCNLGTNILCSQPPTGSSSLQGGDSGGPLVATVDGAQTLIGVNVFVATSGSSVWQGSTKVSGYLSFIHDTTGIPYR